jgi:hypothetical protein
MTYQLTVTDTTTVLAVTESPVLITEQVAGIQGLKGDTGTAATIAAGTTTTGAAGTSASVTNVGTSSAATFNFTIPRGNTGEKGDIGLTGQGYTAKGAYAAGTAYVPYDVVYFSGNSYRCKANTTGNTPTNTTYWELLTLGFVAQGAYSASTTYYQGDVVSYLGSSYYCYIDGTTGRTPTNATYWQIIANKGDTGTAGAQGPTGSVAPTFWYSPSSNYTTGTLTALTAVDLFGLTNGVTVVNSKTYFVDYLITGSIASTGSTSGSLRLTMAGDAVSNFNFITQQSGALSSSPNFNWTSANDYEAFINATTSNFQVGGTLAPAGTAQQFQLRFTGILRTAASGSYFQPKIALSAVSGTTITVNRESFASLLEIGTSATTSLGTWS